MRKIILNCLGLDGRHNLHYIFIINTLRHNLNVELRKDSLSFAANAQSTGRSRLALG